MQVIEMEVLFFAKSYISTFWQRNLKKIHRYILNVITKMFNKYFL